MREAFQPRCFIGGELPVGGRDQTGEIKAKHRADEQTRIDFAGFDRAGFEARGERAPRSLDGLSRERLAGAHAAVPWAASWAA